MKRKYPYIEESPAQTSSPQFERATSDNEDTNYQSNEARPFLLNPSVLDSNNVAASPSDLDEAKDNKTLSLALMKPIFKKIGFYQLNLGLVYFLEYVCLTSYAERYIAKLKHEYPERANEFAL